MRPTLLALLSAVLLHAQWKLPASTPDLNAPPPKAADGKPDLSGIWEQDSMTHFRDLTSDMKPGDVPWRPEAKALRASRADGARGLEEPDANCLPQGVPKINAAPVPFKIVQTPKQIAMIYEFAHATRNIPMDGSPHLEGYPETWMGDSRGRWEGNTLVVDVTNFKPETWLDGAGNFHSSKLHVVERYTRTAPATLRYEATIEDPEVFDRPWTIRMDLSQRTERNAQLVEHECERDAQGVYRHPPQFR
mgnify:CR=1 FL=1